MKQILILLLIWSSTSSAEAQVDSLYQTLIAEAGLYHLRKDSEKAITYFEKAFQLKQPDPLSAYKAAGAYSLEGNTDKALFYLEFALRSGWTEAAWLSVDPYFDRLRSSAPERWKKVEHEAFLREKDYEKSLKLPALRKQINSMTLNDQKLRYKRIQAKNNDETEQINFEIGKADSTNLVQARKILKEHGWPKLSEIGKDGQNNFWLIAQHADQDVLFQQRALAEMETLKKSNEINLEHYAFLDDRVQCNLNFKQLYGTQVNWTGNGQASGFRPILEEHLVDQRRIKLGLLPLSTYALSYGFKYTRPTATQAHEKDSADLAYTRQLIDSADYFFSQGKFEKTYDYYNIASTVLGGMTSADNYNAAIVFAKISSRNSEQKYKDIALDFLSLLYQRKELTKVRLNGQPEFKVIRNEQRWKAIYKELK